MKEDERPLYVIRDWNLNYEVAQSRRCPRLTWVAIPNKHDGKGFRRTARQPNQCQLFAAFVLMVQVASKCSPRGCLCDADGPMDALDLADKTGFPSEAFQQAMAFFTDPSQCVLWLERLPWENGQTVFRLLSERGLDTGQDRTEPDRTGPDRTEQDKIPPVNSTDFATVKIPSLEDYGDLMRVGSQNPVLAAMMVTREREKKAWGHWVKMLRGWVHTYGKAPSYKAFMEAVADAWGEVKAGEAKRPGAIVNLRLAEAAELLAKAKG